MIDPYSLKKAKEDEEDKMLKEVDSQEVWEDSEE